MTYPDFWVFALAAFLLNITPGNDMIYVASRSTGQGIKAGIISSLGIFVGCAVHVLAAVAGLSAIIAKSVSAFNIIKYLGAAYLVYLGVRALLSKKNTGFSLSENMKPIGYRLIFWQGVFTNVLNPKVALFFLAFLPQFISVHAAHPQWQILFLGTWFNLGGTLVNMLVALLFGKMGNWLSNSPRFLAAQQRITGIVLISLGIKVALTSKK
jgi:threonine/homoserine/homoserine lactone efflux protein